MQEIDCDIVVRAQAGDEAACRTILMELHRPVIGMIRRFLGPCHLEPVEDVAQEVFLRVFRSIARFDVERGVRFSTWVFSITRNYCFDVSRRPRLNVRSLEGRDGTTDEIDDPAAHHALVALERHELGTVIHDAVARLSEDYRVAFVMREYEGLPYREIAHAVGANVGTVKTRLHRARKALRVHLSPYLSAAS